MPSLLRAVQFLLWYQAANCDFRIGRIPPGNFEYPELSGHMSIREAVMNCENDVTCAGFTFEGVMDWDDIKYIAFFRWLWTIRARTRLCMWWYIPFVGLLYPYLGLIPIITIGTLMWLRGLPPRYIGAVPYENEGNEFKEIFNTDEVLGDRIANHYVNENMSAVALSKDGR